MHPILSLNNFFIKKIIYVLLQKNYQFLFKYNHKF